MASYTVIASKARRASGVVPTRRNSSYTTDVARSASPVSVISSGSKRLMSYDLTWLKLVRTAAVGDQRKCVA
jgi:hypothetical protein